MKIEDVGVETKDGWSQLVAKVVWEDSDRPSRKIFYRTAAEGADYLSCGDPHPFVVGSLVPAVVHAEARLAVEGRICPELANGLNDAMHWLSCWSGFKIKPLKVEAEVREKAQSCNKEQRSGSFISGGVDSMFSLRMNQLHVPPSHPHSIKDGIFVRGFDIGYNEDDAQDEIYKRAFAALSDVIADTNVNMIPLQTNIRHLDSGIPIWVYQFHGAALASAAHALCARLSRVSIASTYDINNLKPWGSHPLLDTNYSSHECRILHDGVRFSRFDKVRVLADWDVGIRNLRVCTQRPAGSLNCGRCEKCVRTLLELAALNMLDKATCFDESDLTSEDVDRIVLDSDYQAACYEELVEPLEKCGRGDLAGTVRKLLARWRRKKWLRKGWKYQVLRSLRDVIYGHKGRSG
ncbi:MAG: hypothetical protein JW720_10655 [Sedimentisphaerales bacterium]|nr:hypothetical protein [Sedimentisphaerales bacterium]